MNPILVDSMDGIIGGHGRLSAARKLGLAEVPVARKRQAVSGPGIYGGKPLPAKTPEVVFKGDTRDIAGKAVGVSGRTVQAAVAVLKADPEAFQRLKEGKANVYTEAARVTSQGVLRRDAKKQVAAAGEDRPAKIEDLDLVLEPAALDSLLDTFEGDYRKTAEWWQSRVGATYRDRTRFPVSVASLQGPQALACEPQVTVGTIHSVKGGEADVIMLIPDVSAAGQAAYLRDGATRDSMFRLFYVGLTRARETLYICARESAMAVRL